MSSSFGGETQLLGRALSTFRLEGKRYLINVSAKDKQLVKALGFEGLYDSPQDALKPLMRLA